MRNLVTVEGGTEKIRGMYLPFLREGRVALVCNCGSCQEERKARGEVPIREMQSANTDDTIRHLADCGINLIIPGLPGELVFHNMLPFDEPLESWDKDPLAVLIESAHRRGIEVHPLPGCISGRAHKPEFRMVNGAGDEVPYADPGKPEVRDFYVRSALNLLRDYEIDGISLDGIRYAEMEFAGDCCYCRTCRTTFEKKYGFDPIEVKFSGDDSRRREQSVETGQYVWNKAREDNVTQLVLDLKAGMRGIRKEATLSAYVWGYPSRMAFQNWTDWLHDDALDWLNPSGYTYPVDAFRRRCIDVQHMTDGRRPFAMTLGPHTSHGKLPNVEALLEQIAITQDAGSSGYVLFTHSRKQLLDDLPRIAEAEI